MCSEVSVPEVVSQEPAAGPVGEGLFSKKRSNQDPATPSDTPPAEVDAASFASGGGGNGSGNASRSPTEKEKGKGKDKSKDKIKRDKRNLLPQTKPEKVRQPFPFALVPSALALQFALRPPVQVASLSSIRHVKSRCKADICHQLLAPHLCHP